MPTVAFSKYYRRLPVDMVDDNAIGGLAENTEFLRTLNSAMAQSANGKPAAVLFPEQVYYDF